MAQPRRNRLYPRNELWLVEREEKSGRRKHWERGSAWTIELHDTGRNTWTRTQMEFEFCVQLERVLAQVGGVVGVDEGWRSEVTEMEADRVQSDDRCRRVVFEHERDDRPIVREKQRSAIGRPMVSQDPHPPSRDLVNEIVLAEDSRDTGRGRPDRRDHILAGVDMRLPPLTSLSGGRVLRSRMFSLWHKRLLYNELHYIQYIFDGTCIGETVNSPVQ